MRRLIVLIVFTFALAKSSRLEEFLFENQEICGFPFSDAQWLPVLDVCDIKCEEDTEICVENDDLVQKCNKLPSPCVNMWRERQKTLEKKRSRDSVILPALMLTDYKIWSGRGRRHSKK